MHVTENYKKHTVSSSFWQFKFFQKFLIENYFQVLLADIKEFHPKTILEVGCGEGFVLEKLRQKKIGSKLEGVDFSKDAIEIGKKIHPQLKLKQGDIYRLHYADNSFDLVICCEVLEHLERPQDALKELKRVSKKYLVLSVPNEPLFRIGNLLRGKNISRLGNDIEHIQHWSTDSFKKFVEKYLKIIDDKTPLPWTILTAEK